MPMMHVASVHIDRFLMANYIKKSTKIGRVKICTTIKAKRMKYVIAS